MKTVKREIISENQIRKDQSQQKRKKKKETSNTFKKRSSRIRTLKYRKQNNQRRIRGSFSVIRIRERVRPKLNEVGFVSFYFLGKS